jgi:glycosyltransferase involved in cell wall biosynthesis
MKISIIIPVYNAEKTIVSTLDSVLMQSHKDFNIIIINDGSKDSSVKIIENYIKCHSTIDIKVISQKNHGVSKARNAGLEIATGNWIALLDSDDKWMSNKLERQMQILQENPNIDFLGANRKGEHYNSFLSIKFALITRLSPKNLLCKNFFATSTVIFKREIIEEIGFFDENQRYCEDVNYFIKIANSKECYLLNESLVVTGEGDVHYQEKGLSSNLWAMQKGELTNLNFALNAKIINLFDYFLIFNFSFFKYFRRVLLVKSKFFTFYK